MQKVDRKWGDIMARSIQKMKMKGSNGKKIKKTWFDYLNYILLALFALICLYPMIYVLACSFNSGTDYVKGGIYLWPRDVTFENFLLVFNDPRLWRSYGITILRTVFGTVLALLYTSIVGYAMSRKNLRGRSIFYKIFIFTMFFSGGTVPYYLIIIALGLFDNFLVYIIPCLFSVYNMLVFSNFFRGIPEEIRESAVMDGASETRIFFSIILPLSMPVVSTVALWIAVGHWNSFYDTMLYTSSDRLWTLQYYLMKVIKESSLPTNVGGLPSDILNNVSPETVSFAAIIISVIPILIVYPLIFKMLTKGVVVGSLKG